MKLKQVHCLESVYIEKDVMCVFPMGYGKSLIFHLLPMLLFTKHKLRSDALLGGRLRSISTAVVYSIVIEVSPLNSLIGDQISRLKMSGIQASVIGVKDLREQQMGTSYDENIDDDFDLGLDFSFISFHKELWMC